MCISLIKADHSNSGRTFKISSFFCGNLNLKSEKIVLSFESSKVIKNSFHLDASYLYIFKVAFLGSLFWSFISLCLISINFIHSFLIFSSTICLKLLILLHSSISDAGISLYVLFNLTYSGIIFSNSHVKSIIVSSSYALNHHFFQISVNSELSVTTIG